MKERFVLLVTICIFTSLHGKSQRVMEFSIKPTEAVFLNFEVNAAIGNKKTRYGILLSYRPSTQDSGLAKNGGSGAAGGYGHNHYNKLYNSFTVGFYRKSYFGESLGFWEVDIFYRNWSFKDKQARFETKGYSFQGVRTENVNVYGLKILMGQTFFLTRKDKRLRLYGDIYAGAGIRYKQGYYKTSDGYVNDVYYDYIKEKYSEIWPSPQLGIKLGLMILR